MRIANGVVVTLGLSAAIFGFFYAWVCSTMWGLDRADPRVAGAAMQAMNASVRNMVFAPAFFGAPPMLALAGVVMWAQGYRAAGALFGLAAGVLLVFAVLLTMAVNVPMNEALARVAVPDGPEAARRIWSDYSPRWQVWNQARTLAAGLAFGLALAAVIFTPRAAFLRQGRRTQKPRHKGRGFRCQEITLPVRPANSLSGTQSHRPDSSPS